MIITLLIVCIMLNAVLKLSFWKVWQGAVFAAVAFGFVWLMADYASEQSAVTLAAMMSDSKVLSNITVLLTIETAVCIAFCFSALRKLFKGEPNRWAQVLQWYPNLLLFPTLFYVLTQAIFSQSGVAFDTIALVVGGAAVVVLIGGSFAMEKLMPEEDIRLELHFLMSLPITLLGLISTANGQIIYVPHSDPINFKVLDGVFLFFLLLFLVGVGINKMYWRLHKTIH